MALTAPELALFEASHMQHDFDRTDETSLAEMTEMAIGRSSRTRRATAWRSGGRVNHAGNLHRSVTDGAALQMPCRWRWA